MDSLESKDKGDDELSSRTLSATERRSSFASATDAVDGDDGAGGAGHELLLQSHGLSAMEGAPRPYANLSMVDDGDSIIMTPTMQFVEQQPVTVNVKKGCETNAPSRSDGSGGGRDARAGTGSPLDDLLVDLKYDSPHMAWTCIAGFALGAVLNKIGLSWTAQLWVGAPGYFFISAIECLTLPLIFTSVTICFANPTMSKKTKGVMVRMTLYFVMASFLACCAALCVSYMFSPSPNGLYIAKGSSASACEGKQLRDAMQFVATNIAGVTFQTAGAVYTHYSFADQISYFFDNVFAQNIAEAFSASAFLAVTVFSVFFGAGLVLAHDPTTGEQNHAFVLLKQVDLVLELILNWVMPWTPIGTFSAMTFYIMQGTITQSAFKEIVYFTLAMVVALLAYFFLVACVGYFLLVRKNPFPFVWYLLPAMIFMFSSSNHTASIPVLMRCIESSKQVSRTLSQYTVCIGVSLCLSGTAAFFVVATVFMAYTGGVEEHLTLGRLITLVVISTLSSIGIPHEAGFSLSYLATIWVTLFPIPIPASFLYLNGVEWLIKRLRRMTNVMVIAFIARVDPREAQRAATYERGRARAAGLPGAEAAQRAALDQPGASAAHELNAIEAELKEAQSKAHENYTQEMKMLLDKAAALQASAAKMAQEHQEEEDVLRKKKCKTASEVASIVEKYDSEMVAMEEEVHSLKTTYKSEQEQCEELREHFIKVCEWSITTARRHTYHDSHAPALHLGDANQIAEEQSRIDAEEKVLEEIRAREREKQQFVYDAATKIQKVYRGMLARREYAKVAAKNKKGRRGTAAGKKGKKK